MPLSWLYQRVKSRLRRGGAKTCRTGRCRPRSCRPAVEAREDRRLLSNVQLSLGGGGPVSSFAGVGFRENQVATLSVSVNGQGDPNPGDFQAQIGWGDSQSSAGDLVYLNTSGAWSHYLV